MISFRKFFYLVFIFSTLSLNVFAYNIQDFRNAVKKLDVGQVENILRCQKENLSEDDFFEFVHHQDENGDTVLHLLAYLAIEKDGRRWNPDENENGKVIGFEKIGNSNPDDLKKIKKLIIILLVNGVDRYIENDNDDASTDIVNEIFFIPSYEYKDIQRVLNISNWDAFKRIVGSYMYSLLNYFWPEE